MGRGEEGKWEQGKLHANNKMTKIGYITCSDSFFPKYISFPLPLQLKKFERNVTDFSEITK